MDGQRLGFDAQAATADARSGPSDGGPRSSRAVAWARDAIVFSSCNEDSTSELRAFGPLDGKHVLCITAGGGRVLNLLLARPQLIWAVDLNPAQNYLLELKVAAMRAFEHDGYLRFLGVRPCSQRLSTYAGLRDQISEGAREFFDAHPAALEAGVLLQGKLERYLCRLSTLLRFTHGIGARRVFECDDIERQRAFLSRLDRPLFRALAHTACRRGVLQAFSGDPGFYRYVPPEVALHREIYRGVIEHFRHHLARENPLMQLIFFGRYIHEAALPAYLNAASYERIRAALASVRLVLITGTIEDAFAQSGPSAFDALSISDISSYLDDAAHERLFAGAIAAARPGAVLCSRSNIRHRPLRPEHEARLQRDRALESALRVADHSCVHEFLVGKVI